MINRKTFLPFQREVYQGNFSCIVDLQTLFKTLERYLKKKWRYFQNIFFFKILATHYIKFILPLSFYVCRSKISEIQELLFAVKQHRL